MLSGADYPIKPANQILDDLVSGSNDVYIYNVLINYDAYKNDWQKLCYERYCHVKFWIPFVNRQLRLTKRLVSLKHPLLTAPSLPFSKKLRCFAGGQWFSANRKTAKYLIEYHRVNTPLASHYRRLDSFIMQPEESYYHTILCNAPQLKICNDDYRYID